MSKRPHDEANRIKPTARNPHYHSKPIWRPQPLDTDEFEELLQILFMLTDKLNFSYAADVLGTTRKIVRTWMTGEVVPTWPWWNLILRECISNMIADFTARNLHPSKVERAVKRIQALDDKRIRTVTPTNISQRVGAVEWLKDLMYENGKVMTRDQIFLGAPYSRRMIDRAANHLGVVKHTAGFGKLKGVVWELR